MGNFYSVHTLGLLRECDRCFYYKAVENRERPEGPTASITFAYDKLFKRMFDSYRGSNSTPPHLAPINATLYTDQKDIDAWRNKGMRFKGKNDVIFGKLDDVILRDGKAEAIDFKTRYGPGKEDYVEYYRTGLNVYNYLLRELLKPAGIEVGDTAHLLVAWPTTVDHTTMKYETQLIAVPTSREYVHELMKRAVSISGMKAPPKAGEDCGWCGDRRRTVREYRMEEAGKGDETDRRGRKSEGNTHIA